MDIGQMRTQYKAKIDQARKLSEEWKGKEDQAPQSVFDQINALLGESDTLRVRIETADRLEKGAAWAERPATPEDIAAAMSWRQAGPDEGNVAFDAKAFRRLEMETPFGKKEVRYHVPLAVQKKGYESAFEAYLRFGIMAVKERYPQDAKTLSEGVDTAGGYLVTEDIQTTIIKKQMGLVAIRPNARVITTGRDVVLWPRRVYNTDNIWTSGVRVTWTGETPASSTSSRVTDPTYGVAEINVNVALASMPVTNSLIEDNAYDVMGDAVTSLMEAFLLGEDSAFIAGSGAAQPMGLVTQVDVANVGISSISVATTPTGDSLIDLYYGVPAQYRAMGKWVLNSNTMKVVEKIKDAQNRYLIQSLINGSLQNAQFDTIKGKPVVVDEFMPDIGTNNYPILFGDLSGYLIVDRVGFSVQRLTELYAETDITLLLARKRVGGQPIEPYRMRVQKIT